MPPLPEAPSDPGWGDFAAWSQCSATCGAGQISRMRLCTPKIEENGFKNFTVCDGYPQECFIFRRSYGMSHTSPSLNGSFG